MSRLSKEDREIRKSRGIPLRRFLPFALPPFAIFLMSTDQELFVKCLGHGIPVSSNKYSVFFRMVLSIPCGPIYFIDVVHHWPVIVLFVGGVVFSIRQFFWLRRNETYWNSVREKERQQRAKRAASKAASKSDSEGTSRSN